MPEWMNIAELAVEQPEKRIHMERYEYAASVLSGKRVLDCACGMGYGTAILASAGCRPTGIDIDPAAISLAHQKYPTGDYVVADAYAVPLDGYEAVVSFETLEHLEGPQQVINRLPENVTEIIASVPIRPTVGWNPWHKSDFTKESFRDLIRSRFEIVHEWGQLWVDGADLYLVIHGRRNAAA